MIYSTSQIKEFLNEKLECGHWECISEYGDIYTEEFNKTIIVFGNYDFINYKTASDQQLKSIKSGDMLYVMQGDQVVVYRWLNRKINTWLNQR